MNRLNSTSLILLRVRLLQTSALLVVLLLTTLSFNFIVKNGVIICYKHDAYCFQSICLSIVISVNGMIYIVNICGLYLIMISPFLWGGDLPLFFS